MNLHSIAIQLPNEIISKEDLVDIVLQTGQSIQESSVYWLIRKLQNAGLLIKVGRNKYRASVDEQVKQRYHYQFSDGLQQIVNDIEQRFPLVDFQVWEAVQFNYFVNHLIAKNIYFVEVEGMLTQSVFEFLRPKYDRNVLLKPDMNTCLTYVEENTIIVQDMVTETPVDRVFPHGVVLEKLLVDLLTEKKMVLFMEKHEFPHIYEDAFSTYIIDESKMFRYARRRAAEEKIREFIKEKTDIHLQLEDNR